MPGGFSLIAPVFCHSPKMCVRLISESKLSIMAATCAIMHLINKNKRREVMFSQDRKHQQQNGS